MGTKKGFNPIAEFKIEEGNIQFNNSSISNRDGAFLCYYYIQSGDCELIRQYIYNKIEEIKGDKFSYTDEVIWLWLLGEYINRNNELEGISLKEITDKVVGHIEEKTFNPAENWIPIDDQRVFLTNLAMAYGALKSINNTYKSEISQKLIIKIRETMFQRFLRGGKVISILGEDAILGDISFISVPFGLLDAGNQILVETINEVEEKLVEKGVRLTLEDNYIGCCERNDLTCLLAWYYSERGDMGRSKCLLNHIEDTWFRDGKLLELDLESRKDEQSYESWDLKLEKESLDKPLTYILYEIARLNILKKEQFDYRGEECIQIIHSGSGIGNPYIFSLDGRYPRFPEEGETVYIRAFTHPIRDRQTVRVIYSINERDKKETEAKLKTSSLGEKYWEADIGAYNMGDEIRYWFEVLDEKTIEKSDIFNFTVRKWLLTGIAGISQHKNEINLLFKSLGNINRTPCLNIKRLISNLLKWSFSFLDEPVNMVLNDKLNILEIGDNAFKISSIDNSIELRDKAGDIIVKTHKNEGFFQALSDGKGNIYKIKLNFNLNKDEKFYGLGERYSHIEYRGLEIDNYVYNQYRNQGLRTYIPIPFMISSKGYAIHLDTSLYSCFRFGNRKDDLFEIEANINNASLDMYLFTGSPKEILYQYSNIIGKGKLPPKWAFGPWMSSNNWDSQEEVMRQVELGKKYEIPSTVIVLEQWSDEATFYIFNDAQYETKIGYDYLKYEDFTFPEWGRWPYPKKMVEELHGEGLKVLLWQAPVMKYMDGIAHAQRDEDERVMLEKDYHVKNKNGEAYRIPLYEWFKRSLVPDFTNPKASEWWLNKRLYLLKDIGIDGFKTDGGECIYGEYTLFYDGSTGDEMRNKFPNLYIGSFHEFVDKHTCGDGITFSRAGYTGAQKYPLHWAGDESSTFEAFRASLRAGLSAGMSGLPFWGWDLAGFNGGIPTAELYIRATQMAAFCPVMQYHAETKGEFNQDRTPWNIAERTGDERALSIYKEYADLRMNLLPYIYQEAVKTRNSGVPLMRAMFLEYPQDENCRDLWQQYFFGENLMVAPVIEEGECYKEIYFPEGKWMNLFSPEVVEGSCIKDIRADMEDIPVFMKEDSVIPLNLSEDYKLFSYVTNIVDEYKNLCFMIFIIGRATCNFIDDLGNEINISISKLHNKISVKLDSNIYPITLIFRNTSEDVNIEINEYEIINNKENISWFLRDYDLIITLKN